MAMSKTLKSKPASRSSEQKSVVCPRMSRTTQSIVAQAYSHTAALGTHTQGSSRADEMRTKVVMSAAMDVAVAIDLPAHEADAVHAGSSLFAWVSSLFLGNDRAEEDIPYPKGMELEDDGSHMYHSHIADRLSKAPTS